MENIKETELRQFVDISRKMLESAKNNDWDKLPDLEDERKKIMLSIFESGAEYQDLVNHDSGKLEQMIKNVLSMNEQIEQLAGEEKITIGQQLQVMKKKQSVNSAYLQNK